MGPEHVWEVPGCACALVVWPEDGEPGFYTPELMAPCDKHRHLKRTWLPAYGNWGAQVSAAMIFLAEPG